MELCISQLTSEEKEISFRRYAVYYFYTSVSFFIKWGLKSLPFKLIIIIILEQNDDFMAWHTKESKVSSSYLTGLAVHGGGPGCP